MTYAAAAGLPSIATFSGSPKWLTGLLGTSHGTRYETELVREFGKAKRTLASPLTGQGLLLQRWARKVRPRGKNAAEVAWAARKQEIDALAQLEKPHREDYEQLIEEWRTILACAQERDEDETVRLAQTRIALLEERLAQAVPPPVGSHDRFTALKIPYWFRPSNLFAELPYDVRCQILQDISRKAVWEDRRARANSVSPETDRSLGKLIDRFLAHQDGRLRQAQISKARRDSLRSHLATLSSELRKATEIEEFSTGFLSKYHYALSKMIDADCLTQTTASDKFAVAKTFIRWMWSEGIVMELPRNIDSRELRFTRTPCEHRQFTVDEVHDILASPTPDRTRLYILLILNCGFTQADVANLLPSEVDFETGTITRKRTKTRAKTSVPIVRYTLWPETLALLHQEQSEGGNRVFSTSGESRC